MAHHGINIKMNKQCRINKDGVKVCKMVPKKEKER